MEAETMPTAVSVKSAAKMMDVTERTIYIWLEKRGLNSYKIGKNRRILVADLVGFVKDHPFNPGTTDDDSDAAITKAADRIYRQRSA